MNIQNSAKAIILHDGKVLVIKNAEQYDVGEWYSLPGGRQVFEEDLRSALIRECFEELGVKVKLIDLLFVREYIHTNHRLAHLGSPSHKIEFMFHAEILDSFESIHIAKDADDGTLSLEWVSIDSLKDYNIFPSELRNLSQYLNNQKTSKYWGDIL